MQQLVQDMPPLAAKARLDARDHSGRTALHVAAAWGRADVVRLLAAAGASTSIAAADSGETPLHVAAGRGQPAAVAALLAAGASTLQRNLCGQTALECARAAAADSVAASGAASAVQLLIRADEEESDSVAATVAAAAVAAAVAAADGTASGLELATSGQLGQPQRAAPMRKPLLPHSWQQQQSKLLWQLVVALAARSRLGMA